MKHRIYAEGSPFIIVGQKYANEWNAQEAYASVRGLTDYLSKIDNHTILAAGDEPMAVRIVQEEGEILIIRWMHAPNSPTVDKLLENDIIEELESIEEMEVRWDSNKLDLFDSLFRFCEASVSVCRAAISEIRMKAQLSIMTGSKKTGTRADARDIQRRKNLIVASDATCFARTSTPSSHSALPGRRK